jgi:NADH-quinone oxidoreductase subunit C
MKRRRLVPPTSQTAITDLEQLKDHPALKTLLDWKREAVEGVVWDRNELSVYVDRSQIREACSILKPTFNFLSDLTCTDWYPTEPRFHVVYHLLSHTLKDRVRLKVKVSGDDATVESIMPVWLAANFFEREIFDLFGVRFLGHPDMRRIMMPEDWDGHPLRKDYPVEGYR